MARKSTPQPLTLAESTNITSDSFQRSPLSPISPKSPRSPFSKFSATARKLHSQTQADLPVQAVESQPSSQTHTLPSSQTVPALPTQQQTTDKQDRDRPSRGGFFSNYKASKSSSRLQEKAESARQQQEDIMSKDTDRPVIAVVSSKDKPRSGANPVFDLQTLQNMSNTDDYICLQNPVEIVQPRENLSAGPNLLIFLSQTPPTKSPLPHPVPRRVSQNPSRC